MKKHDKLCTVRQDRHYTEWSIFMKEKKNLRNTLLRVSAFIPLVVVLVYMIWCAVNKRDFGVPYVVLMSAMLLLFWIMTVIVVPYASGEFAGRTPEQMSAYRKYGALELAGYAGLAYFAGAMSQNTGLYGAMVFAVCTMYKRRFRDEFYGIKENEDGAEETAAAGDLPGCITRGRCSSGEDHRRRECRKGRRGAYQRPGA
jgi:hypothetical protein